MSGMKVNPWNVGAPSSVVKKTTESQDWRYPDRWSGQRPGLNAHGGFLTSLRGMGAWCGLCLFYLSLFTGCSGTEPTPDVQPQALAAPDEDSTAAAADYDVTQSEAESFAAAWAEAMVTNDVEGVRSLFDWDGLCERVAEPLGLPAAEHGQFVRGMKNGNPAGQLTNQIASVSQTGGSYKVVRVLRRDGRFHAVFRMTLPNQGMNYHDIRVVRSNGNVMGDRLFVAINSEEMADTMRSLAMPAMKSRNLAARLSGRQKAEEAAFDTTIALLTAVRNGQFEETVRLFEQLPEANQNNKSVMLGMITAQSQLDETKYLEAIDRYRDAYPNDPSLGLVLLDAAVLRQDWDLLETSRTKLNAWTGGDPYVDLMIAAVLSQDANSLEKAVALSKDIDPGSIGLPAAHDHKLMIALHTKDFKTVVQQIDVLNDDYGVGFTADSLRGEPLFEDFVEAPEFTEWLSRQ